MQYFDSDIIQKVRAYAKQIEAAGKLPADVLEYIYDHKLFKLFLPESLNGRALALPEALHLFEEAAQIDGSFGWLITIGCGGAFFSAYMQNAVPEELFTPENAVVAGSGGISGTAEPVNGGYHVKGQWQYCSGAHHATIFTANCRIPATENQPEAVRSFILLPEQVTIIEDWHAFGMKGTGSHSIKVENAFVPAERTFDISQPPLRYNDYILYRFPFFQFAEVSFAAVALGVTQHFLEEAFQALEQNRNRRNDASPERYNFIRKKFDDAHEQFTKTRSAYYETVDFAWEELTRQESLSETTQKLVAKSSKKVAQVCLEVVHDIFPYLGMPAVTETTLLNQLFRDLHTVCQHTVLVGYL